MIVVADSWLLLLLLRMSLMRIMLIVMMEMGRQMSTNYNHK